MINNNNKGFFMQYYYDSQIRRYIQQFVRLFGGFTVEMGTNDDGTKVFQTTPVRYGDVSRMAAHIVRDNSENVVNSTPFISCFVNDMSIAPERRTHAQFQDKVQTTEKSIDATSGEYTEDVGSSYQITRYQPVPYQLTMQVDIWTSNTEQKLQLLEQILVLFNPTLNVHTTSNPHDWTSLAYVELSNLVWSVRTVPSGVDEIIDVATLQFIMPVWISPPVKVQRQNLIHTIINNIHDVDDLNLAKIETGEDFESRFTSHKIVTLNNYKMRFLDGFATILNTAGGNTDSDGNTLSWANVLESFGELTEGLSQMRLRQSADPSDTTGDVIGTLAFDPSDAQKMIVTIDTDTLPADTQGTVDAIVDPTGTYPGDGSLPDASVGQVYLLVNDVPVSGLWNVTASANDIITYNGSAWIVSFDASAATETEFVTNTATTDQYEWTGSVWQNSHEGVYNEGFWRIYL